MEQNNGIRVQYSSKFGDPCCTLIYCTSEVQQIPTVKILPGRTAPSQSLSLSMCLQFFRQYKHSFLYHFYALPSYWMRFLVNNQIQNSLWRVYPRVICIYRRTTIRSMIYLWIHKLQCPSIFSNIFLCGDWQKWHCHKLTFFTFLEWLFTALDRSTSTQDLTILAFIYMTWYVSKSLLVVWIILNWSITYY